MTTGRSAIQPAPASATKANDIGVLWPPARKLLVHTVDYTRTVAGAKPDDEVIAAATRIALKALA